MGAPYFAFTWEDAPDAKRLALHWREALVASGFWTAAGRIEQLEVWTGPGPRLPVARNGRFGAVIIGHLNKPATRGPVRAIAPTGSADVERCARQLVAEAWGSYLALWRERETGRVWVLRDPSGALDALTWRREGLAAVGSGIEHLPASVHPQQVGMDWDVVTDFVRRPISIGGRSALRGFEGIAPGDLQPMGAASSEAIALWRPATWARRATGSRRLADADLRDAVERAVLGTVEPHDRCLVEVSGGLDSAIVATTARSLGLSSRLAGALHLRGDRLEGDERHWAQAVAEASGLSARTVRLRVRALRAEDYAETACGVRPAINALDVDRDERTAAAGLAAGAQAIVTGKGGDAVFFQHPTGVVVSDYLRAKGWGAAFDPYVRETARRLRRSIWSVLAEAARALRVPPPGDAPQALWGARTREPPTAPPHPWLDHLADIPPAKRCQIEAIVLCQLHRGATRYGRGMDVVHPLLAQPLLEFCLSTSVWDLTRGGRDRGLARLAFSGRVPAMVIERRSKGELTSFYTRTVAASLPFLRPHLLDGCLVAADVLDGRTLESALKPESLIQRSDAAEILTAAAIESWVRRWQTRVPDAPDAGRLRS